VFGGGGGEWLLWESLRVIFDCLMMTIGLELRASYL
jgi:hypothetical protein